MTARNTITSLTDTITQTLGSFWDSAKSYLADEPTTLWQKAMKEPGYQAYRQFKSDLAYQSEIALQTIVSPYAVIVSEHATDFQKEAARHLLNSNSESAVTYFYDDVMNHLVELSYDNSTIEDFTSMLAFYESYVPEAIYQRVLQHCQAIDKTNANVQTKIIDVTKKINKIFKSLQMDMNSEIEKSAPENHEHQHRPSFNQLIMMGAISLLANKHNLGLSLGLATTALFADPVDAALPTVANRIPIQYAQPGQPFSYDIDLNHVFNDADGDIMTFGGVTMADGSPLPSWLTIGPVLPGNYDTPGIPQSVAVQGGIAYVADYDFGLQLINVSNPLAPNLFGSYDTPGTAFGVAVQGGIAYVADGYSGLQLINVSNPAAPSLLANYITLRALGVVVEGGIAYVADDSSGLQIINVSNPAIPSFLASYNTPGQAISVVVQAGIAFVADNSFGLQIINVSNPVIPSFLASYNTPGNAYGVAVQAGIAFVADNFFGLQIINVSNPAIPSWIGSYDTPGQAYGVVVQADIVFVADFNLGLQLINVSNPAAPILLISYTAPGNAYGVAVQAGIVYVAYGDTGLQIIGLGFTRLNAMVPFNVTGNYSLIVHATNENGESIFTGMVLSVANITQPNIMPTPMPVVSTAVPVPLPAPRPISAPIPAPTPINIPPILQANTLTIITGNTMTLSSLNFNATDDFTPASNLLFIVSQVSHGYFQASNNPTVPIYSFTQQQIQNGNIQFVHDGSTNPPSYQVYVNDGSLNSLPQWAAITFNGNAVPVLMTNQMTISAGQTVILNSANLYATDTDNPNIDTLIFTVSDIQHGFFANRSNPTIPVTTFTQGDINAGNIQFTHDGSTNYPSYFVSVSDGTFDTPPSLVQINFNNNAIPIVLSNQITITPGESTTIGIANIGGLDLDSNSNNLIFIITDITGGQFELISNPGVSIGQFTQQDIINGNVQFTADAIDCQNLTSPSYNLQASDGSYSTVFNIANVEYNTHTTTNGCVTITTEKDNTNLYIGVGVGVGAAALVAGALGIFAMKRRHQRERDAERVEQMVEMTQDAAKYKSQVLIKR